MLLDKVIGAPSVDVHVSTHGDQLSSRQIVQGDIIVEQLGDSDYVGLRRSLTSRSNLNVSAAHQIDTSVLTFRKNSLNSSLLTTLSAFRPPSLTVSCKNLAVSILARSNLRCFSSYQESARTSQLNASLTAANCPSNVLGSILGNSLSATGSKISMKGTKTNTENGIKRNKSLVVRRSCTINKTSYPG